MADDGPLLAALETIRQHGAIGESSLDDAVAHSSRFAELIPESTTSLADLGSGGGLPGLVIAWRCPWVALTLIERRTNRADQLVRAVRVLGLSDRVRVMPTTVEAVAQDLVERFEVITARSFGAPLVTLDAASQLVAPGGCLLVSEPPHRTGDDRFPHSELQRRGFVDLGVTSGVRLIRC